MDEIETRIRKLEASNRRQRAAIAALACTLVGAALVAATRPAGDATFDSITCKRWAVVDAAGVERITTGGKGASDSPGIQWTDPTGKVIRMAAGVSDQEAKFMMFDKVGKRQIELETDGSGASGIELRGPDGKFVFTVGTRSDGRVRYMLKDAEGK